MLDRSCGTWLCKAAHKNPKHATFAPERVELLNHQPENLAGK